MSDDKRLYRRPQHRSFSPWYMQVFVFLRNRAHSFSWWCFKCDSDVYNKSCFQHTNTIVAAVNVCALSDALRICWQSAWLHRLSKRRCRCTLRISGLECQYEIFCVNPTNNCLRIQRDRSSKPAFLLLLVKHLLTFISIEKWTEQRRWWHNNKPEIGYLLSKHTV